MLFISTGTYFELFDLEISGYLEILEMNRNNIYTGIHFLVNMLALFLFTLRCSQTTVFGGTGLFLSYTLFS
jgi:hypothetical protein